MAGGYGPAASVPIRSGASNGWSSSILRKKRLAASRSRLALSRKSIDAPFNEIRRKWSVRSRRRAATGSSDYTAISALRPLALMSRHARERVVITPALDVQEELNRGYRDMSLRASITPAPRRLSPGLPDIA